MRERLVELLVDAELRRSLGAEGHETVHRRFLLTRLIADELRLYASVMGRGEPEHPRDAQAHRHRTRRRDPVCGLRVDGSGPTLEFEGHTYLFCSGACAAQFSADPERFARSARAGT
jgi:YHS domain-containing protein